MRLQFSFAWPLLFSSGYLLATMTYGGFSWLELVKVALIGFFGFEAGLVLNDYVDRDYDKKDVDGRLTKYWRISGTRPIPSGLIPPAHARMLFLVLAGITTILILTPALSPFDVRAAHHDLLLCHRGVLPGGETDPAGVPVPADLRPDRFCPLSGCRVSLRREPGHHRAPVFRLLLPVCPCPSGRKRPDR